MNSETQYATYAADALELCHSFVDLKYNSDLTIKKTAQRYPIPSALVVDAKSLYDVLMKEAPAQGTSCKQTAIEQLGFRQTLTAMGVVLRWVSSERHLADGFTKCVVRQLIVDRLRPQAYRLVHDS